MHELASRAGTCNVAAWQCAASKLRAAMASRARTPPAPRIPESRPRLPRQRARQLARRDRARDPRLRPDRQPDGDRGPVLRHALRPGACSPRRSSRGSRRCRSGSCFPVSTPPRRRSSSLLALIVDSFALAAGARARDRRRLARLGRAGADPRRRDRGAGARRPAARGQRAAQHRLHRRRRRRPGDRRRSSSPAPGSRRRCSPTRSRSWRSPACSSSPAACELPEPEEPEARWTERLRRGLAYVRERPGAAAPARRPGARLHLLRPGDPDRGRVREGDARRRATPATAPCSPAGALGMVAGSLVFAALRRVPLRAAARRFDPGDRGRVPGDRRSRPPSPSPASPRSSAALGNGVQWIGLVTAVQELTRAAYQARVLSLLEALASAMPGIGFLLGGAIAAIFEPRAVLRGRRRRSARGARGRGGRACAGSSGPRSSSRAPQDGLQDGASSVADAGSLAHGAYTALTVR